jgi:hypothetical protein
MRTILLVFSLIALAAPSYESQRTSLEKACRAIAAKEKTEGSNQKKNPTGQLNVQRFSDCLMGGPR